LIRMKGGISFSCPLDIQLQRRWKNVIFPVDDFLRVHQS
jgi:hypothetical protein